jgi:hypothetical protein
MSQLSDSDKELIEQLHLETAKISWLELQRFFASGKVLLINTEQDLLEVAVAMARDDAEALAKWIDELAVKYPSDEQAKIWFQQETILWTVVVKPWILVQELS